MSLKIHWKKCLKRNFSIKVNYHEYAEILLDYFTQQGYEIYLIPHVGLDKKLHDELACNRNNVFSIDTFNSPVEIKSYIAGMDLFIGARMHGTVAAFTSGVPCIPTAYSRKFAGVYDVVGYPYVIDLQKLSTQEAIDETIKLCENIPELKEMQTKALEKANAFSETAYHVIYSKIKEVKEER